MMDPSSTFLRLLAILYIVSLNFESLAQVEKISITPPTAASIAKFVDVPVSNHTGIPEISIPIHTVKEGSLQLPISLSYHSGGMKVMEQASWVGAGWTLNAGGVITRSMRGYYDEKAKVDKYYLEDKGYYGYLYGGGYGYTYNGQYIPGLDYMAFANGQRDGEPDLFFFNFNSYSGKFYFRADGSVMLETQQDLLIETLNCAGDPNCITNKEYIKGFIITTPNGDRYHFGKTLDSSTDVDPLEWTQSWTSAGGTFPKAPSSWFLNKIESADGNDVITLKYANEDYSFYNISTFNNTDRDTPTNNSGTSLLKQRVDGVRLDEIFYNNNSYSVKFFPNDTLREDMSHYVGSGDMFIDSDNTDATNGARALKTVKITEGTLCKEYVLSHSYFTDNTNSINAKFGRGWASSPEQEYQLHTDKKRLKLKSVQERSCGSTVVIPPYKFSYYDEGNVPRTLSMAQDHWGFYNGADENDNLIPLLSTDGGASFSAGFLATDRESSWPSIQAGTLKTMQYPTGGWAEFIYGPHKAYAYKKVNFNVTTPLASYYVSATKMNRDFLPPHQITVVGQNFIEVDVDKVGEVGGEIRIDYTGGPGYDGATFNTPGRYVISLLPGTYNFTAHYTEPTTPETPYTYRIEANLRIVNYSSYGFSQFTQILVGGLRVEQVKVYEGVNAQPLITTYDYKDSYGLDETGVLFSVPHYISQLRNDRIADSGVAINTNPDVRRTDGFIQWADGADPLADVNYAYSPGSIHPLSTSQGSHIGYGRVKVIQPDGGYSVYVYNTSNENPYQLKAVTTIDVSMKDFDARNFPPAPEAYNPNRGALQKTQVYSSAGKLLKETVMASTFSMSPEGIHGLIVGACGNWLPATEYKINQFKKTFESVTELTYDQVDATRPPARVIKERIFDSPNHAQVTRELLYEVIWNSSTQQATKGKILSETKFTYASDILILSCNPAPTHFSTLETYENTRKNQYLAAIGSGLTNTQRFLEWQDYTWDLNEARKSYVTNRKNYFSQYKRNCEINPNDVLYNNASADLKAILDLKKMYKVASPVETLSMRDGKFLSSSLLLYKVFDNNRKYVFPYKFDLIQTNTPLLMSTFSSVAASETVITKDTDYETENTYTFKNGLQSEIVGKDGVTTSYKWGYENNFPVVQAVNATEGQVYYNSFETTGTPGASKSGSKYLLGGAYSIPFSPPAGPTYKMSYWYWSSNQWNFSGVLPFNSSINNGTRLDEIRVYPEGALITTYSYEEGKGVSSIMDSNNAALYYSYDDLGRLNMIKDDKGKVLKTFSYGYRQNTTQ